MEETYRPIIDKAKEFIDFFIVKYEEIWVTKIDRTRLEVDPAFTPTRNHLAYGIEDKFLLYTPLGVIELPGGGWVDKIRLEKLNKQLTERFGLIEIRPNFEYDDDYDGDEDGDWDVSYSICKYALYGIPIDSQQGFPLPPVLDDSDILIAYQPRMDAVFRLDDYTLSRAYYKLRMGYRTQWNTGHMSDETFTMLSGEYNKWKDEMIKVDDTIPIRKQGWVVLCAMLGIIPTRL
jgi:hypothetical protein